MRPRRPAHRLAATAAVVLLAGCSATSPATPPPTDIGSEKVTYRSHSDYRHRWEGGASGVAVDSTPLRLLREWDAARAAAYAEGSVPALRRLYTRGSSAGEADLELLREYGARGLRVVGMQMQVLRLEVLDHAPGEWRLRVTDRLHGAVAVSDGRRLRLPRDRASTREVRLVRDGGGWRVAEVLPVHGPVGREG